MNYSSTVTSKGTITIPAEVRRELGIKEGMRVEITKNSTGHFEFKRMPTIEEVRALNKAHLQKAGKWPVPDYKSGDGFRMHVEEKYGSK